MKTNVIYNEDNIVTMKSPSKIEDKSIDIILTSPPYLGALNKGLNKNDKSYHAKYDIFEETMNLEEYRDWTLERFECFDRILKDDGIVIYNISYSAENPNVMPVIIGNICEKSNFSFVDMIAWKKKAALPNNRNPNRLTRIVEPIFIFCKKGSEKTFKANKRIIPSEKVSNNYEGIFNFIEAKNSDETCPYNWATFSTDLVSQLLNIYAPISMRKDLVVYDPFSGTGTTAFTCKKMGIQYIGSELSENQCKWAENRLKFGKGETAQEVEDTQSFRFGKY